MTNFVYWPYDEVQLSLNDDQTEVVVKTPWLQATAPVTDDNRSKIATLAEKLQQETLGGNDIALANWFFSRFEAYPLCYIVPTPRTALDLDSHQLKDSSLLELGLAEVLAKALAETDDPQLSIHDVPKIVAGLSRSAWQWDVEAAATFAKAGDDIHPESVFSVARRFHMLEVLENNTGREQFSFIEDLEGDEFAHAAALMVRQNHYVTKNCQEALRPALSTAGSARPLVEEFMAEENGHDLILNVAMKSLVADPETIPASLQTKALMQLLRFAASRNFLAFALAVDFFERSTYEKVDPLAQLLIKGGFDKAARQINRHMQINDAGEHENVACGFLQHMSLCSFDYVKEAFRLGELITLVMNSVPDSAVALYRQG